MHAYRTLSVVACVQAFCVVAGTLFVSQILKLSTRLVDAPREYRALAFWIREWGFALLLIPVAWIAISLLDSDDGVPSRYVFLSGCVIIALLVLFYGLGLLNARRTPLILIAPQPPR